MAAETVALPRASGPVFVDMEAAPAWSAPGRFARRMHNRGWQAVTNHVIGRAARALERGDAAVIAEIALWRRVVARTSGSHATAMAHEAVRTIGPHTGLPAPPIPSDWFAPVGGQPRGFIFYVHGGSFAFERSPVLTRIVARFAATANARVFAPNYRLAPEHRCPAAVDDVVDAFRWFRRTWPTERVVTLADSAGCAVLLAALQRLQCEDGDGPNAVLLFSPWVDLALQSWTVVAATLAGTTSSSSLAVAMMAHLYLGERQATDPVASPLYGDFTGFPPMLIHASRGDFLYGDAVRLAERVRDCGGDLTVRQWTEDAHVWEKALTAKADRSIELGAEFIRRHLD